MKILHEAQPGGVTKEHFIRAEQGGLWTPFFRDSTPTDPKGHTFVVFCDIHLWLTDPNIFLNAPCAPMYTNFKEGARAKKLRFFGQNFPKKS